VGSDTDPDLRIDLDDPRVRREIREEARALLAARLGGAPDGYTVTREQAEAWSQIPTVQRADRRVVDAFLAVMENTIRELREEDRELRRDLDALAQRKRDALYGAAGRKGIESRVDDLEERVGKPESLTAQVARFAAFIAAATAAAAAGMAVARVMG